MKYSLIRAIARDCYSRFCLNGKTEYSTRDFTCVAYPELKFVVVQWAEEDRRGNLQDFHKTVKIAKCWQI